MPLYDINLNVLSCEWQLMQFDDEVRFKLKEKERIDEYWSHIFDLKNSDASRYPLISYVVKAALSLPHGSADVERGFSTSGQLLTEDKTKMSKRSLNAKQIISDALKKYRGDLCKVPIPTELLNLGQTAYSNYKAYLDEQKRIEEERLKKEALVTAEKIKEEQALENLKSKILDLKTLTAELKKARIIYHEALANTEAMENIIAENSKKNLNNPQILSQLMSSLASLRKKEKKARKTMDDLQEEILKKNESALKSVVKNKLAKI